MNETMKEAIAVLVAGGFFKKFLAPNFRGHMKFNTRLFNAAGEVVSGHGPAMLRKLSDMGILAHEIYSAGTVERWAYQTPSNPDQSVKMDQILETL